MATPPPPPLLLLLVGLGAALLASCVACTRTSANGSGSGWGDSGNGNGNGNGTPRLLQIQVLTRHGSRAPDAVVARKACTPLLGPPLHPNMKETFVEIFGTNPGELTRNGVKQMRDVGEFLREHFVSKTFRFDNYPMHTADFEFVSREGSRQQRSMMGIVQGLFPRDEAVPISVMQRDSDALLGGPPPQCHNRTANMITRWYRAFGPTLLRREYDTAVAPVERVCNVSLLDMPMVDERDNGDVNPLSFVGDLSDLMDSLFENNREPLPLSATQHAALNALAFELEQRARFYAPEMAAMMAGDFPESVLGSFETIARAPEFKRSRKTPFLKIHTASRDLMYGMMHLFGWFDRVRVPGQPVGRLLPGSTFLFELWSDLTVRVLFWNVGSDEPVELQPKMHLSELRARWEAAQNKAGRWRELCGGHHDRATPPLPSVAHLESPLVAGEVAHDDVQNRRHGGLSKRNAWMFSATAAVMIVALPVVVIFVVMAKMASADPVRAATVTAGAAGGSGARRPGAGPGSSGTYRRL